MLSAHTMMVYPNGYIPEDYKKHCLCTISIHCWLITKTAATVLL